MSPPPPPTPSRTRVLLLALLFHIFFIPIVFDTYFTSPVVHGMREFQFPLPTQKPKAKRLVLIVGDGLRADLLLNTHPFSSLPNSPNPYTAAPHLRSIIETRGAWGISHTRVPTESRPGHVAIIGGMYEDVSAVTKGWKVNPITFDTLFNHSSTTFAFGSPDIIPMFVPPNPLHQHRVQKWCYDAEAEDFTKDATHLDTWVLSHLSHLLSSPTPSLNTSLHAQGTIFFLHLLGLDTTGHAYRPHSMEYMKNIQVVDGIVNDVERLFEQFYGDDETAWVFTSDHGMGVRGNHGDGHPDNTQTPLIAWGAGVRGPVPVHISPPDADTDARSSGMSDNDLPSNTFNLSHLLRVDISQADLLPLMSTLLGIPWAVNSVGVLPEVLREDGVGFLDMGEEERARVSEVNAKMLLEGYRVKHELKRQQSLFYKPFPPLHTHQSQSISSDPGQGYIDSISAVLAEGRWEDARRTSRELIEEVLQGLRYLQTYDWVFLRSVATAGYVGWSLYAGCYILSSSSSSPALSSPSPAISYLALSILGTLFTSLWLQSAPWRFYVYVGFAMYFWKGVFEWASSPSSSVKGRSGWVARILWSIGTLACMGLMVAGYTHRSIWTVFLLIIGILWPLSKYAHPALRSRDGVLTMAGWSVSCILCGVFPLLSVDKEENLVLILCGAAVIACIGLIGIRTYKTEFEQPRRVYQQIGLIGGSALLTASSVAHLQARLGLPQSNQITGWVVLVISFFIPFASSTRRYSPSAKLLIYFLTFGPLFVILSISVEGLFYAAFGSLMYFWTRIEPLFAEQYAAPRRELRLDDLRIALTFLLFVQVAFFGTGNVASISSFYLEPVYRLIPVFSPFTMAVLLVIKIIAPYVILSVSFATLNTRLRLKPFDLFMVALSLTDVMTLTFFYRVRDEGSWLEIGQTISFFIISSLLLVWSGGICMMGQWLMGDESESENFEKKNQ